MPNSRAMLLSIGLLAETSLVTGQLLLKPALRKPARPRPLAIPVVLFTLSIAAQALYFFLWIGLLSSNDLSRVYPLDAMGYVLLVLAAIVFLRERLTPRAWFAITLIVAGVAVISLT